MKQNKILFLGGAFSQVPAIQYAKDQGYFVITADYLPENPGHKISDEYYNVSTTLKEEILILSEKLEIDAISAYASDPAAPTAAYVSEKMKLVGSSFKSVEILSRKNLFRAFLKKNGFKSPWFINGSDLEELKNNYSGKPAILKPVDSSGSKGIFLIQNYQDLKTHFHESKNYSRSGEVILEQFIERKGPQIHGDGFVIDGKPVFLLLGDQIFSGSDNIVPYSTIVPSWYHTDVMEKVHTLVESALSKVGFDTGGINVEVIRDKNDDLYILEIGARNGGNFMPQLIKHASGFDLVKVNVDALFQKDTEITTKNYYTSYYAQVILHSNETGIFQDIDIPIEFKDKVLEKTIYYKAGDKISAYKSSKDVVGVMIIEVDEQDNQFDLIQEFLKLNQWVRIKKYGKDK